MSIRPFAASVMFLSYFSLFFFFFSSFSASIFSLCFVFTLAVAAVIAEDIVVIATAALFHFARLTNSIYLFAGCALVFFFIA